MPKKILVTGGAGFIGSHLVKALNHWNHDIIVIDDLSTGSIQNIAECECQLIKDSITSLDLVTDAMKGCDAVFHLAANANVPLSIADPSLAIEINILGTCNILEAARKNSVNRVIFSSSASVYGNQLDVAFSDETGQRHKEVSLLTPYAASKRIGECLAEAYIHSYGMEIYCLRYMNVFGPRQSRNSTYTGVITKFCESLQERKCLVVEGTGLQKRDFIYVGDIVEANILALESKFDPDCWTLDIGTGIETSILEIINLLQQVTNSRIDMEFAPGRSNEIMHSIADTTCANKSLGFKAKTPLLVGLKRTFEWHAELASLSL